MKAVVLADRYQVERVLGRGGMGAVLAAIDRASGTRVALKLLDDARLGDDASRARFAREAELGARLQSVHAARVLDRSSDPPFFVLEHLTGTTLERALDERGPIAPARAIAIACAVLDVLIELHALGFAHADVKPGNVYLVEGEGAPAKLLDLGLATPFGERCHGTTAAFAAPEQVRGEPLDARSDVYAVGATLHRMLTGELVHPTEPIAAFHAWLADGARPRAGSAPELDAIVLRALAPKPEDRFPSATAMRAALDQRR
jgi:serine/threonine-protein kinase